MEDVRARAMRLRAEAEAARARRVRRTRTALLAIGLLGLPIAAVLGFVGLLGLVGVIPRALAVGLPVGVLVGVTAAVFGAFGLAMRRPEHLRQTGVRTPARFVELARDVRTVAISSESGAGATQLALRIEVTPADGAPYAVVVKDFVPYTAMSQLVAGKPLTVFVDPRRKDRVLIDWEA